MANPYYVAPESNFRQIIDPMLKVGNFMQNQQQLEQHARQLDMAKRVSDIEYGSPETPDIQGLKQQGMALQQQQVRNETAKVPEFAQNFGEGDLSLYNVMAKQVKIPENSLITQKVKQLVEDKNVDKLTAYHIIANDPDLHQDYISHRRKDFEKKVESNPSYATTQEGQKQYEELQALSDPNSWKQIASSVFSKTLQSYGQDINSKKTALTIDQVKGQYAQGLITKADALEQSGNVNDAEKLRKVARMALGVDAESKPQTEEQLTARALRGDTEAQAVLDAMQTRKLQYAEKNRTIVDNSKAREIDVPSIAQSVIDGQDAPIAIRGSMGNPLASKVKTEVLKKYPKFNMGMADANYKWKQSATNQRTINFAGGALPRLSALDEQLSKLPNVDLNMINKVMSTVSKEFGKPEYTNFESNRNAIVQEINTALSGSSQSSDMRLVIELENLKSARSPAQIRGAISNLREALIARVDTDLSPLYPIEVVRGDKTLEQYKADMFKRYRGNYGAATQAAPSSGGRPPLSAFQK